MNPMIKKWTATTLALAMAVSMGVSVSAKPQSSKNVDVSKLPKSTATAQPASASDYAINVAGTDVQFIKNGKVVTSYAAKAANNVKTPDLNIILSQSGNLCLYFTKSDGKAVSVSLGQQGNVAMSGDYNTLTFDTTIPADRSFTVGGSITTLNVNAPVSLTIAKDAVVNSLKVGNTNANVTVETGAAVAASAASNKNAITGLTNIGTMAEVTTSVLGGTAASSSASTSDSGSMVTSGGLKVEMKDASDTKKYASSIAYGSNNTIVILPKSNVTLANLMKDIKLTVRKADNNNIVTGDWKFIGGVKDTAKATPGTYKYQFTPHQAYKGFDIIIEVVGAGSSATSVSSSPKIAFYSGVGRGSGGTVDVDITLPAGVTRGDVLELHAGSWSTTKTLVTSDAGETNTYTVQIDENLSNNSKVKVYCVLRTGGKSLTSNTITYTYNENGDTKTLKKPGLSLSPSHSADGKFVASVTLPASVGDADEVVVYATRKGGSSREVGSENISDSDAGKTIKIRCEVSVTGDEDEDEFKVKATIRSGGSSISSDTKTFRGTR